LLAARALRDAGFYLRFVGALLDRGSQAATSSLGAANPQMDLGNSPPSAKEENRIVKSSPALPAPRSAIRQLRALMTGTALSEEDPPYEASRRIWNGAVDRRPAIIARCLTVEDVQAAVGVAREHGLAVSVRGGGHDWAGRSLREGGLVVDLSGMRRVAIDPGGRTATIQGGATIGDLVAAARPHGLALSTGTVKAVGMAGLTLAGGYGPLNGRCGLALDNLLGADVVLADGQRATANGEENVDLYWALRGGGGNFGIATCLHYRLHPIDSVIAGFAIFPLNNGAAVLHGYRHLIASASDELTLQAGVLGSPDGPMLFLFPTWSGDRTIGEKFLARLKQLGSPLSARIRPMAYEDALGMFDAFIVNGRHWALKTRSLSELSEDAAAVLLEGAEGITSPFSAISIHHFHGAAARVPVDETAFALRRDHLMVEVIAAWDRTTEGDGSKHRQWARNVSERLAPYALPGGYPNLLGPEEHDRVLLAYGPNAPRLLELKRRFDPDNFFASATPTLHPRPLPDPQEDDERWGTAASAV
jgi:FAD/FMN-containing dehydrogenase